jgi:hypothetical protein
LPTEWSWPVEPRDADELTGQCAPEDTVRRAVDTGRYVLTDQIGAGPAMFDTARLDRVGGLEATDTGLDWAGRPPPLECAPPASTRCSAREAEVLTLS